MASKSSEKIEQLDLLENIEFFNVLERIQELATICQYVKDIHVQWYEGFQSYFVEMTTDDMEISMQFSPPKNATVTLEEYEAYFSDIVTSISKQMAA
ncbi:MAG: hypothetical protein KDJ23_00130 [Rhodoblastus sp.]|nr:hypothetical protein [Rhodoblastus sp.]MCB9999815.1 hypothetical protein [Methylobacteriaceae bacterium]MCC0001517.1 hypothetical protein [Methylobacteriaceae bacterium]